MKAAKFVSVVALLAFFHIMVISSVRCEKNMILEKKNIQFFKVEEMGQSPVELNITGLAMHSSLVVESIETSQYDFICDIFMR